jgi:hypothetical protein
MNGVKRRRASLLALALLAAACSGSSGPSPSGSTTTTTPSTSAAAPALVASLPAGCKRAVPAANATVSFVAQGRAWAVAADGTGLTCLFEVTDPGPFAWGPRADRVLLGGLEVRGVGSAASRPSGSVKPSDASWGRPTGLAVVFIDSKAKKLQKALVGGTTIENVTPAAQDPFPAIADVTFQQVVYHPSGRAFGIVLTDADGSTIWMSSNTGATPQRLVWSKEGNVFGPIAFGFDGNTLYYGVHVQKGDTSMIARIDLKASKVTAGLWKGQDDILRLVPAANGKAVALDTGAGCDDRKAMLSDLDGTAGRALLPSATDPTSVVGWMDDGTLLVGEGGCNQSMKLWQVKGAAAGSPTLFFDGADRAAVRVADPTPTPPLPNIQVNEGLA